MNMNEAFIGMCQDRYTRTIILTLRRFHATSSNAVIQAKEGAIHYKKGTTKRLSLEEIESMTEFKSWMRVFSLIPWGSA